MMGRAVPGKSENKEMMTESRGTQRRTKKFCMLLGALCFFLVNASAQITFQKAFGDSMLHEIGNCIRQTSDGGFIIAATQYGPGNQFESIFLIRTNAQGDTLWSKLMKESVMNYSASSILETFNGDLVITGVKGDGGYFVPFFMRLDSAGTPLLVKNYLWFAEDHINAIVQTPDSGFLMSGYVDDNGTNSLYFIRTNSSGDTLWAKAFEKGFYNPTIYSLQLTNDHGFIVAGSMNNTLTQDVDAFAAKLDSACNIQWAKSYGESAYDFAQMAEQTRDGGYIIAANTYSFGVGLAEYFLIKTDASGNLQWSKTYGGPSDDRSECVKQLPDNGYLLIGESASFSSGNFDIYMIRTDANGDTLWTKTLNGPGNNQAYSMMLTSDSCIVATGIWLSSFGSTDVLFLKSDRSFSFGCGEVSTTTYVTDPIPVVTDHVLDTMATQVTVVIQGVLIKKGTTANTLCLTDGISEIQEEKELMIYPNPATDQFTIHDARCTIETARCISIFNLTGENILTVSLRHQNSLLLPVDISRLPPGIYILEIQTSKGIFHSRLVKS